MMMDDFDGCEDLVKRPERRTVRIAHTSIDYLTKLPFLEGPYIPPGLLEIDPGEATISFNYEKPKPVIHFEIRRTNERKWLVSLDWPGGKEEHYFKSKEEAIQFCEDLIQSMA